MTPWKAGQKYLEIWDCIFLYSFPCNLRQLFLNNNQPTVVAQYKFDYSGVICVWLYVLGYALGDVFSGVCTQ